MTEDEDLSIPAFLDRRLSAAERAAAGQQITPRPATPLAPPTADALAAQAWEEAYQRGLAKDREARQRIEDEQAHRAAIREALAAPAKLAFFERVEQERAAVRAVKAAAALTAANSLRNYANVTAKQLKVTYRPRKRRKGLT